MFLLYNHFGSISKAHSLLALIMAELACFIDYGVIMPIISIISIAILLWFIYKYLKSMKAEGKAPLKYLGLTFFCTQTMFCMVPGVNFPIWAFAFDCTQGDDLSQLSTTIAGGLITAQYLLMILILFYRLKIVFDGTTYELSRCTIWAFVVIYILTLVFGTAYTFANDMTSSSYFEVVSFLLTGSLGISLILFVTFMFVKKLIDVNKRSGAEQSARNKLLSAITKQAILTFISISSLLVLVTMSLLFNETGILTASIHGNFVFTLCAFVDLCTNFICILLSYSAFSGYYMRMCGCCDTKCRQLCDKSAKSQEKQQVIENITLDNVESVSGLTSTAQSTSV